MAPVFVSAFFQVPVNESAGGSGWTGGKRLPGADAHRDERSRPLRERNTLYVRSSRRHYARGHLLHGVRVEHRDLFPDRTLRLEFGGQRITLSDLIAASTRLLGILTDVDAGVTEQPGG
jgi:hypothetical protein